MTDDTKHPLVPRPAADIAAPGRRTPRVVAAVTGDILARARAQDLDAARVPLGEAPTRFLSASTCTPEDIGVPMTIVACFVDAPMPDGKEKLQLRLQHRGALIGYTCNGRAAMALVLAGCEEEADAVGMRVEFGLIDVTEHNGFDKSLTIKVL
ncbi:MAG: hypothetical protein KFB96_03210 [Thiocapsa sp.]|uniref:hypothetical protein n=1 Tax=Thiocapsa sp. TaxID=2024551 RepID=UPI001BD04277|nr:hypothetical protein [Thiocapsa sp.]QVL49536.1 MAG: hypothetical protein KFB96_03210 [Thiocapsa sp.]